MGQEIYKNRTRGGKGSALPQRTKRRQPWIDLSSYCPSKTAFATIGATRVYIYIYVKRTRGTTVSQLKHWQWVTGSSVGMFIWGGGLHGVFGLFCTLTVLSPPFGKKHVLLDAKERQQKPEQAWAFVIKIEAEHTPGIDTLLKRGWRANLELITTVRKLQGHLTSPYTIGGLPQVYIETIQMFPHVQDPAHVSGMKQHQTHLAAVDLIRIWTWKNRGEAVLPWPRKKWCISPWERSIVLSKAPDISCARTRRRTPSLQSAATAG